MNIQKTHTVEEPRDLTPEEEARRGITLEAARIQGYYGAELDDAGFWADSDGIIWTGAYAFSAHIKGMRILPCHSTLDRRLSPYAKARSFEGWGRTGERNHSQAVNLYQVRDFVESIWELLRAYTEILAKERREIGLRIWQVMERVSKKPGESEIDEVTDIISGRIRNFPELNLSAKEEQKLEALVPHMEVNENGEGTDYEGGNRCTLDSYFANNEINKIILGGKPLTISTLRREAVRAKLDTVRGIDRAGRTNRKIYKEDDIRGLINILINLRLDENGLYTDSETGIRWGSKFGWLTYFDISSGQLNTAVERKYPRGTEEKEIKSQGAGWQKCWKESDVKAALKLWIKNHSRKPAKEAILAKWEAMGIDLN